MPRVFEEPDGTFVIELNGPEWAIFTKACGLRIDGTPRTKNPASRDKSLAQGKPAKRSAKGNASKAGKPPRKGTRKK